MQVRLKECGAELIEVADNGSGIAPEDYAAVAAKYHTSKIRSFKDVESVNSFGFRGEALSSLCAVSQLSITTRTSDEPVGTRLTFDQQGNLVGELLASCPVFHLQQPVGLVLNAFEHQPSLCWCPLLHKRWCL